MSLLALQNKALKGMFWRNKCCSAGKSYGGSPGLAGISERTVRHASIDAKSRKSLVYTPPRQHIIPPERKLQRSRILETSRVRQRNMEDVEVL